MYTYLPHNQLVDNSANKSNQSRWSESTADDEASTKNASVHSSEYTDAKEEEAASVRMIHEAPAQTVDIAPTPIANEVFDTAAATRLMRADPTYLAISLSSGDSVRKSNLVPWVEATRDSTNSFSQRLSHYSASVIHS